MGDEAVFQVLGEMCGTAVREQELREAKSRVIGGMVLGTQTISQLAGYRAEVMLNGWRSDYYDAYPAKIAAVTAEQVQAVMKRYVKDDREILVVVALAEKVKEQLAKFGEVEVVRMPAQRKEAGPAGGGDDTATK